MRFITKLFSMAALIFASAGLMAATTDVTDLAGLQTALSAAQSGDEVVIPGTASIAIPAETTITVAEGVSLNVLGKLTNNGTIDGAGTVNIRAMVYTVETRTPYEGVTYDVNATYNGAISGTAPTCPVAYQVSADAGTTWVDAAADTCCIVAYEDGDGKHFTAYSDLKQSANAAATSIWTTKQVVPTIYFLKDISCPYYHATSKYGAYDIGRGGPQNVVIDGAGHTISGYIVSGQSTSKFTATVKVQNASTAVFRNLTVRRTTGATSYPALDMTANGATITVSYYNVTFPKEGNGWAVQYNSKADINSFVYATYYDTSVEQSFSTTDGGSRNHSTVYSGRYFTADNKMTIYGGRFYNNPTSYVVPGKGVLIDSDSFKYLVCDPSSVEHEAEVWDAGKGVLYTDATAAMKAIKMGSLVKLLGVNCAQDSAIPATGAGIGLTIELLDDAQYTGTVTVPTGYLIEKNVSVNVITYAVSVDPETAEVKIGDNYYASFEDALKAAKDGDVLVLNNDVQCSKWTGLRIDKDVTLDLNGYQLLGSQTGSEQYQVSANLTIIDSVGTGLVRNNGTYFFAPYYGGAITIRGGRYESNGELFSWSCCYNGSKIDIYGGEFVGNLPAVGKPLSIYGGTFSKDPTAFVAEGRVARDNGNGTWTVIEPEIHVDTKTEPETREVVIESKEPLSEEQQAKAASEVETIKTNLVVALVDPVVASADTGIKGTVTEESKQEIVKALEKNAAEQGLTEAAKEQIQKNIDEFLDETSESNSSSNFLNIAVQAVDTKIVASDTTVASVAAKATVVVYEVKPIIETVVSNTVAGVTEVKVVTAIIPNETVKELAEQGRPMTFNLPIEDPKATCATVKHVSAEPDKYPTETFTCPVWEQGGKRYITISVAHFSTFEVSTSGAVLVDSDETIGLYKVGGSAAGEVSFGVPFTKSGVTTETTATFGELVTTGAQAADTAKAWTAGNDDTNTYAAVTASDAAAAGQAVWYTRAAASAVPLTVAGFVKDTLTTTSAASTTDRSGLTLFANPHRDAVNALAKLTSTPVEGDQIVVEGSATRYFYSGAAWYKKAISPVTRAKTGVTIRGEATDAAVTEIPVPAGGTFWYVTKTGTPSVQW